MQILPLDAKIYWQIEAHICQNHGQYAGSSIAKVTFGHKWIARQVNQEYNLDVDELDVLATMRYMVEMGNLTEAGMFGSIQTYSVNREIAKWEDEHKT